MTVLAPRRTLFRLAALAVFGMTIAYLLLKGLPYRSGRTSESSSFDWAHRTLKHPFDPSEIVYPPSGTPHELPRIQHDFSLDPRDDAHEEIQAHRREAVQRTAEKSWQSYRDFAWRHDELKPTSLVGADPFSGWGATLVDSLDTLWIMGFKREFKEAVEAVGLIDWNNNTSTTCSVFETNIRYLGGLLSAYDLSGEWILLVKALELGHMLHAAFDTPNHLPAQTFHFGHAKEGELLAGKQASLATTGTLSLEFTKLTQITGDPKFYSAIDRIKRELCRTQDSTKIPGLWPTRIDLRNGFIVTHHSFTLGASADSGYEYLPKMYALLGGLDDTYGEMHTKAMEAARSNLLFRPMLPANSEGDTPDLLFSGTTLSNGKIIDINPEVQHLGCFAGGHFALGGKLLGLDEHVEIGDQLARGCAWAYDAFPGGVMPEVSQLIPCKTADLAPCEWNETRWQKEGRSKLPKGFHAIHEPRYMLRPEAIESIFILYRITGKRDLLDIAWTMFESIKKATETKFAHSAITSVMVSGKSEKTDNMESFWIAETLKYFYLIFSEPDLISLDDYVFNTEAHPFRIPKPSSGDGKESEEGT